MLLIDSTTENYHKPVDRSEIFQRLRVIWPLVEKFISIERSRLRAEGKTRREAGDEAWQLASEAFDDEAIRVAGELRSMLGATPPGLSMDEVVAWRLCILVVAACCQRSPRLIRMVTALIIQSRLRTAMDNVGDYPLEAAHEVNIQESLIKLSTSMESCLVEVDCLTQVVRTVDRTDLNDELKDELSALLEALSLSRDVIAESWATTCLSLRQG